jgi:hypothetical protein
MQMAITSALIRYTVISAGVAPDTPGGVKPNVLDPRPGRQPRLRCWRALGEAQRHDREKQEDAAGKAEVEVADDDLGSGRMVGGRGAQGNADSADAGDVGDYPIANAPAVVANEENAERPQRANKDVPHWRVVIAAQ